MTELIVNLKELPPSSPKRSGRVQELIGIIFQSDQQSVLGSWIIRPVEMLDRRLALTGLGAVFAFLKNGSKEARSLCQYR